jgi:hypothetical protein
MAALLTGDARCADDVAVDSFAALCSAGLVEAGDRALSYLWRQVVIQSRQAACQPRSSDCVKPAPDTAEPGGQSCDGPECESVPCRFGSLPAVLGLMTLRPAEREAVVLTTYLDLPERQAAAAAGVSPAMLRRDLASATETLRAWPASDCPVR